MKKLLLIIASFLVAGLLHAQPCAFTANFTTGVGGLVNFTTNNPAGTPGITYSWNFGDGSPIGSGAAPSHTYAANGNYTVTVTSTAPTPCTSSKTIPVSITNVPANCAGNNADFMHSVTLNTATFTNLSASPTAPNLTKSYIWFFGDNTSTFTNNAVHTYAANGTYNASLVSTWRDTISNTFCYDTVTYPVVIANLNNTIKGYIIRDSTSSGINDNYKVWLIATDASTSRLKAIDSVIVGGPAVTIANGLKLGTAYTFNNVPVGTFRLKAARTSNFTSALSTIPTYFDSSYYWNSAGSLTTIGATIYNNTNIIMRQGTGISGAGFISGAVRRTGGSGIAGMTILLSDAITQTVLKSALTDVGGEYSFIGVPSGTYTVHPENMNYVTTPFIGVSLSNTQPNIGNINFEQDDAAFTIMPRVTSVTGIHSNTGLSIYPNPASDRIIVQWSNISDKNIDLTIVDVTGKVLVNQSVSTTSGIRSTVDISMLNTGIYFVKIRCSKGELMEKVTVKH